MALPSIDDLLSDAPIPEAARFSSENPDLAQKLTGLLSPKAFAARQTEAATALDAALARKQQTLDEAAQAAARGTDANGNTAITIGTQLLSKLETQRQVKKIRQDMDYDALLSDMSQVRAQAMRRHTELSQQVEKDKSVSLFEDPLQALINSFTLPWDQQELKGVEGTLTSTSYNIEKLNADMQQSAKTAVAMEETWTLEAAKSAAQGVAQNIISKAKNLEAQAAQVGADRLSHVMQYNSQQLQAYHTSRTMANDEERMRMSRETHKLQVDQYNRALKKDLEVEQAKKLDLSIINEGLKDLGGGQLTEEMYTYRSLNKDPKLDLLRSRGIALRMAPKESTSGMSSVPAIGGDPVERGELAEIVNLQYTTAAQKALHAAEIGAINNARTVAKSKNDLAQVSNKYFTDRVVALQDAIKPGDESNPMAPVPWKSIGSTPLMQTNPLWKKYIEPQIGEFEATRNMDPNRMLHILTKAAIQDKVSLSDVAKTIRDAAQMSASLNTEYNQFEKYFGFKQTRMNVSVDLPQTPGVGLAADIGTAGALAAVAATGVGLIPAAVVAAGMQGTKYVNEHRRGKMNAMDLNEVQAIVNASYLAELGTKFISHK